MMTREKTDLAWVLFLFVLLGYLLFPGAISWINDEPKLFLHALATLEAGELAVSGLFGSKNIPFGPVPTWYYQLNLLVTENLLLIVQIKALLFAGAIFLSSRSICKTLGINQNYSVLPLLSPSVFHYSRILWDNCLIIPLAFTFVAVLLKFFQQPKSIDIILLCIISSLMYQIHLTGALLLIPAALVSLLRQHHWLRNNFRTVAAASLLLVALNLHYSLILLESFGSSYSSGHEQSSILVPEGFLLFSSYGFFDYFIPEINRSVFQLPKLLVSYGSVILLFMLLPLLKFRSYLRESADLLMLLLFALPVAYLAKLESYPHYFNPLLPVFSTMILLAFKNNRRPVLLATPYFALMASSIVLFQCFVISNSGTRSPRYGATLGNQISIFQQFSPDLMTAQTNVKNYQYFPQAMQLFDQLNHNEVRQGNLAIVYKYPELNGEITVVRLARQRP